ncbi:MAG: carboxylate--amine ligase [Actinobacteria bacterium]|nr:carboxylate--amine ligase [Actinomycetota bacterium]
MSATIPSTDSRTRTLSEADSKRFLEPFGLPIAPERVVSTPAAAAGAAAEVGFPVVAKLCGDNIAHKTERGLVRLNLRDAASVDAASRELLAAARPEDGDVGVLIAPMVSGTREFIAGLTLDPQFGMTVMVGVGGVLAEAIADVSIALVPITAAEAHSMIDALDSQALLGPFRGEPAVDRGALAATLLALSDAASAHAELVSVDLNPLIIADGAPVAVDALVEVRISDDAQEGTH